MAVKSVIDVIINDEKFKKFLASFEKYQAALKKVGGAWTNQDRSIAAGAASSEETSRRLREQEERLKRHQKIYNEIKKASSSIAKDMKSTFQSVAGITKSFLGWVGVAGILTGLLGAGGLWGMDRLAQSVSDARRSSQGLGITSGQQTAFGLNFGRYVDANQNLQAIADAKSDYTKRWAFSAMGINPNGKDPATLAVQMALKAKSIFARGDGSEQYAQAHGLTQFYSMEDLRRLGVTSDKDLRSSASGYGRDVKTAALSDQTQKKWQDFSIQMDRANMQIRATFVEGLMPLVQSGALPKLSKAIADAISTFMKSDTLKKLISQLGDGIKTVADYLSSDRFTADMKTFITDFGLVTDAVVRGLRMLGIIPGANTTAATPGSGDTSSSMTDADMKPIKYRNAVFGWASHSSKTDAYMDYFMGKGWTRNQAAGIVANLDAESHLNPSAFGDNGKAYGVAQWHEDRLAAFQKWMGKDKNGFLRDPYTSSEAEQLGYVNYELREGMRKNAGAALLHTTTAADAGDVVSRQYESPKNTTYEAFRRSQAAVQISITEHTGSNVNVRANNAAAQ